MAHYTRVQGLTDFPTEARAVAKAARDVGIRVALAVHCRDLNPLVYDPHDKLLADLSAEACACVTRRFFAPPFPPADQVAMVEAVAADIEGDGVTVQYGPAGVQWCTDAMLRRIGEASARTKRRVHMHLLETRYQRDWADRTFPQGIVRYLDEIGLRQRARVVRALHSSAARRDGADRRTRRDHRRQYQFEPHRQFGCGAGRRIHQARLPCRHGARRAGLRRRRGRACAKCGWPMRCTRRPASTSACRATI